MKEIYVNTDEPSEALELAIEEHTRDLLLPKLISGEVGVEKIEVQIPDNRGA